MAKTGYLIYSEEELRRNREFVARFCEEGAKVGIAFSGVTFEEAQTMPKPDFVLNRTRAAAVGEWCQKKGIRVFHSPRLTLLGNHKYLALCHLKKSLPQQILDTCWAPSTCLIPANDRDSIDLDAGHDMILKTVDGHGGSEVLLLEEAMPCREKEHLLRSFCPGRELILQERIAGGNRDLRVYILGGEIYASLLRTGKKDFRSNYSLGGSVEPYMLSQAQRELVYCFVDAFGGGELALAGIDFMFCQNRQGDSDRRAWLTVDGVSLVFNELEEMVGSRMLYHCTDKDIVRDFVAWCKDIV